MIQLYSLFFFKDKLIYKTFSPFPLEDVRNSFMEVMTAKQDFKRSIAVKNNFYKDESLTLKEVFS